jgi:hypothetical protein
MPVHDWTRVEAGIFHDFHNAWTTELRNAFNSGLLPPDYYALTEQHAGTYIADVLTLQAPSPAAPASPSAAGVLGVAEAAPGTRHKLTASSASRMLRRTLAIRHVSGHRLIAIVEIVSPANKDRATHVEVMADKIADALEFGVHVLLVDLFAPGSADPRGIHGAVWERFAEEPSGPPPDEPLTLASYVAAPQAEVYLEHLTVGAALPDMPLFLHREHYVNTPLEATYQAAYRGVPAFWRGFLEGHSAAP